MDRRLETKSREYMLKTKSCYDVNFIVTGGTSMCPYGKLFATSDRKADITTNLSSLYYIAWNMHSDLLYILLSYLYHAQNGL